MTDLERAIKAVEDVRAGHEAVMAHYDKKGWPSGPPVKEREIFESAITALQLAVVRIKELAE